MIREIKDENAFRKTVLETAVKQYHSQPEYLWKSDPTSAVLRHTSNRKWFALFMTVTKDKLGMDGTECVDILTVKIDPVMAGVFLQTDGIVPGYHMNKGHWITILLDGAVPINTIELLLNESFELTKTKKQ